MNTYHHQRTERKSNIEHSISIPLANTTWPLKIEGTVEMIWPRDVELQSNSHITYASLRL